MPVSRFALAKFFLVILLFALTPRLLPMSSTQVSAVECPGMTVSSLDRAIDFYTQVLTFRKVAEQEVAGQDYERLEGVFGARMKVARLQLGDECLELTEYLAPQGRPIPQDSRSNDLWFQHIAIVVSDMDRAYAWLRAHHVRYASTGPQRLPDWNLEAKGISAFYFKDEDGHILEIIHFPDDKGQTKWHGKAEPVFLGIDHTAIVVGDTERSIRFYRDLLGLKIVGTSENYGTEQEHLNNVFGAHLLITSLRSDRGPGIELLQYLAPSSGRSIPPDTAANDTVYWQTRLVVGDLDRFVAGLRPFHERTVMEVVRLPGSEFGFNKAVVVKDPDGHSMEFVQR
ncbi:MAG: VOC family protein [Acidobacteriaceae bacterium]